MTHSIRREPYFQAQYGMDERGCYKVQGRQALEKQYYNGQIDLEQYFAGLNRLGAEESGGIEDSCPVEGLFELPFAYSNFRLENLCRTVRSCEENL